MNRWRIYRFECLAISMGAAAATALAPHGAEAVFSVALLTAAALTSGLFVGRPSTRALRALAQDERKDQSLTRA